LSFSVPPNPTFHFSFSHLLFLLLTVTTLPTPVSEITTLSLQSNTNAPSLSATSSSLSSDIDVTTPSESRGDESLKVLPLNENKTNSSNDKDDAVTVTQSTVTVNSFDTEIKPELIHKEGTIEQIVNNDSDNHQTNQPQKELMSGDEIDEKSRLNQKSLKEGRAISFAQGAPKTLGGVEDSTTSDRMSSSINFVTTSTEKTVLDFFDLSDVSMDHDLFEPKETKEKGKKASSMNKQQTVVVEMKECSQNGTTFKVSHKSLKSLTS
jgi:hypothetical protein